MAKSTVPATIDPEVLPPLPVADREELLALAGVGKRRQAELLAKAIATLEKGMDAETVLIRKNQQGQRVGEDILPDWPTRTRCGVELIDILVGKPKGAETSKPKKLTVVFKDFAGARKKVDKNG